MLRLPSLAAAFRTRTVFRQPIRCFASNEELEMTNIYLEWTKSQDRLLWESRDQPLFVQASLLGRGLRGVESRIAKLRDPKSSAYRQLFADDTAEDEDPSKKLVPAGEVLRRIQWDHALPSEDFVIVHYDRVDDCLVESPFDSPNTSISGKATTLIEALPEHRIQAIRYREQIVWDREKRMDHVFSGPGIMNVIQGYTEWKQRKDEEEALIRQMQQEVIAKLKNVLGEEAFQQLKEYSNNVQEVVKNKVSVAQEVEKYVDHAVTLFDDDSAETLDLLSEIVSFLPDTKLRPIILEEIQRRISQDKSSTSSIRNRPLPTFNEDEITETFVRGSGPGGQKINKTSSRVLLVHEPTQVRVECQETRSLQQNRKIARQRLRSKLDEYWNGSQSKASQLAQKASSKKAKARNRARQRLKKKKEAE